MVIFADKLKEEIFKRPLGRLVVKLLEDVNMSFSTPKQQKTRQKHKKQHTHT